MLEKVIETGTPVILIIGAGSALTFNGVEDKCAAILDVWYPGSHCGRAVADLLFGKNSPSGKLPVTFYKNTDDLPEFTDYSMKGRTYRYMTGESLYPFGYGFTLKGEKINGIQAFIDRKELPEFKSQYKNNSIRLQNEQFNGNSKIEVRFAWTAYVDVNLYSSAGLPMKPFKISV